MEHEIRTFWDANPCGEGLVAGQGFAADPGDFFARYDAYRYRTEPHILSCLDAIDFQGRRTLEIGLGQGADSEQIIHRGALWSGIDLTAESVARVRLRLTARRLPFESLAQASALSIPFADGSFDVVFGHG